MSHSTSHLHLVLIPKIKHIWICVHHTLLNKQSFYRIRPFKLEVGMWSTSMSNLYYKRSDMPTLHSWKVYNSYICYPQAKDIRLKYTNTFILCYKRTKTSQTNYTQINYPGQMHILTSSKCCTIFHGQSLNIDKYIFK